MLEHDVDAAVNRLIAEVRRQTIDDALPRVISHFTMLAAMSHVEKNDILRERDVLEARLRKYAEEGK